MTRRNLARLFAGGALCRLAAGETERAFYAVTASPQPHGDLKFPSVLFRLDLTKGEVVWASNLVTAEQGGDFVLYCFEERLLVVAGPKSIGNEIVVLRFDSPGRPEKVSIELGEMGIVGRHFVWVDGHLTLALQLIKDRRFRYLAIRLDDLKAREALPKELYREFAIDGFVGGLVHNNNFAFYSLAAGSRQLLVAETPPPWLPSPIELPEELSFPPGQAFGLYVANSEILVFRPAGESLPEGPEGTTPLLVFLRRTKQWRSIAVPGGASLARGFGPWVVVQVREVRRKGELSPGAEQRRDKLSATGAPFDVQARGFPLYQPGLICLYHAPSQRLLVEETGQGDTEVVWVKDEKVLYRCDRVLYEARIEGRRFVGRRKLLEHDFIADVHWVFYGPPLPAPPDPPWHSFRVEKR